MKKANEIIKYRQDISRRFKKLENYIDNDWVSTSQARELRKNYNIQLHLIDYILGKRELSDLLLKELESKNE